MVPTSLEGYPTEIFGDFQIDSKTFKIHLVFKTSIFEGFQDFEV